MIINNDNGISQLALTITLGGLLFGCIQTDKGEVGTDFTQHQKPLILMNIPLEPSPKWQLVWADEFDGSEINKRNWSLEENCWGGGNNEQQCYTKRARNAYVQDGYLHIVAHKESFTGSDDAEGKPGMNKTLPFTSARLRSKDKRDHKYGRFEIRAKLPSGQGTWPAIWMLPTDNKYGTWAASGEIDIMEAVNLKAQSDAPGAQAGDQENRIYGSLHYGKTWPDNVYSGQGASLPNSINPTDDFHTYAIEWEEGEIRWYVDNIHYATQTQDEWYSQYKVDGALVNAKGAAPFDERFHLLLNLAVGGSWAANANEKGVDKSDFPKTMLVDYVKVYRCSADRWKGKGCATVGDQAVKVKGHQAPAILAQDDRYADGPNLDIFSDSLNSNLAYGSYDPMDIVSHQEVADGEHGQVLKITKKNGAGNLYFRSPTTDVSHWLESGELIFDIKVESMTDGSELMVKIDSGWPKTSDMTVELPPIGQWGEVRIKLADLLAQSNRFAAGNKADPTMINNLLVFEPTAAMIVSLDNIRFEKR
ncbi:glycoside hydrolase family 16 protein [bacterium 19MO03SA05]|uniref:Glycoside hydrolase family 16 protein n=1 Tax=bacterium 19MO03SA05 TaxID=2920620 RepID=A0AAU6VGW0_UNCXX|nr:family 16 glycosylhydrolase [Vibrio metschnikovii]